MQWLKPRSRAIMLIGYDFGASRLFVMFDGGGFYTYERVDYDVVEDFFSAEAPGALITSTLRNRPFSSKQHGIPTIPALIGRALTVDLHSIGRNVHDSKPRSIDGLGPAELAELERYLEGDEDCAGNHRFMLVSDAGQDSASVWHFNVDTGLIVPPEPRVLHRKRRRRWRATVVPVGPSARKMRDLAATRRSNRSGAKPISKTRSPKAGSAPRKPAAPRAHAKP